jgi:hypothetical protein
MGKVTIINYPPGTPLPPNHPLKQMMTIRFGPPKKDANAKPVTKPKAKDKKKKGRA